MSGDLSSSNNDLLKKCSSTVMKDSWLEGLYDKNRAEQQSALKQVFTVISDNNVTTKQKKTLESRAEILKDKLEALEAKMAVLQDEMTKSQEEIEKHSNDIADLVSSVDSKSKTLEKQQKANVKAAIDDVFYYYKKGLIGKDEISGEIKKRVRSGAFKLQTGAIERILEQLDKKQGEVQGLIDGAAKWIDQKTLIESQYGPTKAAYDLINANLSQIGNTETDYTNSDYDAKIPTYSLAKTDIISDFFANSKINVESSNSNYQENSNAPTLDSVKEKYSKYYTKDATKGVDINSSKNKAVANLGKAIDDGLLTELSQAGLGINEISEFLIENFSGTRLKFEEGKMTIPYGHDPKSKKIFTKIKSFYAGIENNYQGQPNTWNKEAGNTISSNKQLESLAKNYDKTLNVMAQDPKFTFKEAMYALFDKDKGLFKDCGINFDLEESVKEGGPSYSINLAGDKETAKMYKSLAKKIKDIWGVGAARSADFEQIPENKAKVKRSDPITFKDGNNEFAFIIDRDKDGTFSGKDEFLGAKEGTSWLDDLKSLDKNGDGKLTGDELKNLKLLGSQYTDNKETKNNKEGYLREETTNIEYSLTDAQSLGIEEIDLNNLEDKVNSTTGKTDINGSELFNDSFSFNLNGKEVNAQRKDDTDLFMETVYSKAYGKNYKIGFSDSQAQEIIDKSYFETKVITSGFKESTDDLNVLKNAGEIAKQTRNMFEQALNRIQKDENVMLQRASNKAAAESNADSWADIARQVEQIANDEGITIELEQAKGIYITNGSLSPRQIVDEYKTLISEENRIEQESATQSEAYKAIVLCGKNNLKADSNVIIDLLASGQAKTAQDVVDILKEKQ